MERIIPSPRSSSHFRHPINVVTVIIGQSNDLSPSGSLDYCYDSRKHPSDFSRVTWGCNRNIYTVTPHRAVTPPPPPHTHTHSVSPGSDCLVVPGGISVLLRAFFIIVTNLYSTCHPRSMAIQVSLSDRLSLWSQLFTFIWIYRH